MLDRLLDAFLGFLLMCALLIASLAVTDFLGGLL